MGETRGAIGTKRLGGKRPGRKRLGGETTRGGNGLGAKRLGFKFLSRIARFTCLLRARDYILQVLVNGCHKTYHQ